MNKSLYCLIFLLFPAGYPLAAQIALAVDGMNALCPGTDNPLTVAVSDVPDSSLLLLPSMGEINRLGDGHYTWRICHRDTNIATLTILDTAGRQQIGVFHYRVVRPPIPVPVMASPYNRGAMPNGQFKSQGGIAMVCENTDWEIKAEMVGYDVIYLAKRSDALVVHNTGGRFNGHTQDIINRAKPGDRYVFSGFTYRIGCDPMVRYSTETLVFRIK